jgi:uncharacterized membrane protein
MLDLMIDKHNMNKQRLRSGDCERPVRSLAKAISWRITGSLDTIMLSWFFTRDLKVATAIGLTEVVTKMVLYYLHERIWNRISLGRTPDDKSNRREIPRVGLKRSLSPIANND